MPYATYRFNKIIAAETIRFIVTVAIVVYKGLKLVVYRMLTVELEFFICHKSDETFYMPDIISRYLKYNSGFISMQKDSNGICIKAKNELGVTISFEFTYSIIVE